MTTPNRPLLPRPAFAALLVCLVAVAVVVAMSLADRADPVAARATELQAAEDRRNAEAARDLVQTADRLRSDVGAVVDGLADDASAAQLDRWEGRLAAAHRPLRDRPSAGTEVNLAASGLDVAVTALQRAVAAERSAIEADGRERRRLTALAADLRDDAVVAWSVAATQLDVAAIDAGMGHAHLFLPARGLKGELTADH